MRPRRPEHAHLPKGVVVNRGTYYLISEGRWRKLGTTEAEALQHLRTLPPTAELRDVLRFSVSLLARTRQNCKKRRRLEFTLTAADVPTMLEAAGWRCAVTRTPFSLERVGRHRPYAPSIDRIDNEKGYTRENCRLVCAAANIAMNVWGIEVLRHIAHHLRYSKA